MSIDFTKHVLPANFDELCKTTTRPTQLSVRKPDNQQYFRVHHEPEWQCKCAIFDDQSAESFDAKYFVSIDVFDSDTEFQAVCYPVTLSFCQYRGGTYFLWPVKIPTGGPGDSWHQSAQHIAHMAKSEWLRMQTIKGGSGYQETRAEGKLEDPAWPTDWTFNDALNIAFQGRAVMNSEHDAVKRVKGLL